MVAVVTLFGLHCNRNRGQHIVGWVLFERAGLADVQPRVSRTAVDIAIILYLTVRTDNTFILILLVLLLDGLFFLLLTFLLDLVVAHLPCEETVEEDSHGV